MTRRVESAARLLALAAWFGLRLQLWLSMRLSIANGKSVIGGLVAYFGYFTILTNVFVALECTAGSLRRSPSRRPPAPSSMWWPWDIHGRCSTRPASYRLRYVGLRLAWSQAIHAAGVVTDE